MTGYARWMGGGGEVRVMVKKDGSGVRMTEGGDDGTKTRQHPNKTDAQKSIPPSARVYVQLQLDPNIKQSAVRIKAFESPCPRYPVPGRATAQPSHKPEYQTVPEQNTIPMRRPLTSGSRGGEHCDGNVSMLDNKKRWGGSIKTYRTDLPARQISRLRISSISASYRWR